MENENKELNFEGAEPEITNENKSEEEEISSVNHDGVPPVLEPTVTFDSVPAQENKSSTTGIKVFFSLISVAVMLVIAVSAGYIFGSDTVARDKVNTGSMNTTLVGKDDDATSDYAAVFKNVSPSVVHITVFNSSSASKASGVIYTTDGYIVTNDHIYSEVSSPEFIVTLYDGREFKAKFIAGDTRSDLAVLKIDATGLTPAVFGNSEELIIGEKVVAVGFPSGAETTPIPTAGIISSSGIRVTTNSSYSMRMIQTDTAINPGSSGGALVNMYSQVVGITSAKIVGTAYDSVGYAIPSATVVSIIDSLINNGYVVSRGKLGINYYSVTSVESSVKKIPRGLQISTVSSESELSGKVSQGDIITHINDIEIVRNDIALDIIDSTAPGVSMSFTVYRAKTGTSETVFAALIPDKGDSSYSNEVASGGGSFSDNNPFENDNSDSFKDH